MPISDRIESTIERWSGKWKDRLKGWTAGVIGFGIEVFMDVLAKSMAPKFRPLIARMEATGKVPPELQPILNEIKTPTGEAAGLLGNQFGNAVASGAMGKLADALLMPLTYDILEVIQPYIVKEDLMIGWWRRGKISLETLKLAMKQHGFTDEAINILIGLTDVIFPSDIVAPAWLRDKAKYEKYWDGVKMLGLNNDQIELLKEMAYQMPSVRDVVGFLAHEVFEPKMIAKYGLDDEWGELDKTLFEKVGLKEPMALNYWRDHWQHASWSQVMEMLHRGVITEQDIYDWFRLVEIPPYWRGNLTKIMYNLPGRIEVRMMAQYGLVDKAKIMELLRKDGLAEEYVPLVADMNLVRGVRTDIQTRYTKGWIDSEGVKAEIAKLDLTPPMPDRLYQWIVTNVKPDRTQKERDLTDAEIVKAVKLGEITWADGVAIFIQRGYDEDEADLKLAIGIPTEAEKLTDIQRIEIDTTRTQRRAQLITKEEEVVSLVALGLSTGLANAYADNDEITLTIAAKKAAISEEESTLSESLKVRIDTIRRQRRARKISREAEITALTALGISPELANAYADNDELRLVKVAAEETP